jgi:DNA polymerase-4
LSGETKLSREAKPSRETEEEELPGETEEDISGETEPSRKAESEAESSPYEDLAVVVPRIFFFIIPFVELRIFPVIMFTRHRASPRKKKLPGILHNMYDHIESYHKSVTPQALMLISIGFSISNLKGKFQNIPLFTCIDVRYYTNNTEHMFGGGMTRTILHVDLNNFYASVECLYHPELKGKPVAVTGEAEARHGIILAKNNIAKKLGVKTGEVIWQARQKCPGLVCLPPDFRKYLRFSRLARAIYADYTDQIEAFGIDEAWLDVTGSTHIFGDGSKIADTIRRRLRDEMGVTGSVGVSFNKIFAKLGSDLKKPDATTIITEDNYRDLVWPLPAGELLYVGRSTRRKLENRAIFTIGELAQRDIHLLKLCLGVWGETLWHFANGLDVAPVRQVGEESFIKSVGNSTTTVRDLVSEEDVKMIVYVLAESVAARLRRHGFKCKTVAIQVRDNQLFTFERQGKLAEPSFVSIDIANKALELFQRHYNWEKPIRSIGVRGTDLVTVNGLVQLDIFDKNKGEAEALERTIDAIRQRFGAYSIQRCAMLQDRKLTGFNPKDDHIIHPVSFFR